ncbi:2Fe-2S iron-sulfur cluster-binding protein [Indioceanicola profundi]|uniref:2Fe-2S iron-sulfur cluster-binding protein n=1 Tax=Indioceanicola profundi TaxID=2220096 RepID=UPI000E6AD0D1|nr:2Fe-2S iron-sulfur cluster-binding protein [Indioceanicola profundi]
MRTLRAIHKWLGLLVGLQLLAWVGSGAVMSLLDHQAVSGHSVSRPQPAPVLGRTQPVAELSALPAALGRPEVRSLRLRPLLDRWVYEAVLPDGTLRLLSAEDLSPVAVDEALALEIARAGYAGPGPVSGVAALTAPVQELRKHEGPVWRVDFADEDATAVYVDGGTGRILAHRTDSWRLFDIAWMLHIMDYRGREDFNHPLIIAAAIAATWLALTGLVMLPAGLLRDRFVLRRQVAVPARLTGGPFGEGQAVDLPAGKSWFEALAATGTALPSECGGVGDCGRCRITLDPAPAACEADRRRIPQRRLDQGVRLACQHAVAPGSCARLP